MASKKHGQILKSFANDTRLRIITPLNKKEVSVTESDRILDKINQFFPSAYPDYD